MAALDRHMQRMESLRKRLGFLVGALRVRQLVSWFLARVPVRLTKDGATIRLRCWSDIVAYQEIFQGGIYDSVFGGAHFKTYCDLGCQSGMALLRLVSRSGAPQRSLLIDGNPIAVARCRDNVSDAAIDGVEVVHGVVGRHDGESSSTALFVLLPNELECSLANSQTNQPSGRTVAVPAIDLESSWQKHCGDLPCDLLKMDVEGAELSVLRRESRFLERVERCVLEWHDPPAAKDAVIALLRKNGFTDVRSVWEGTHTGVLDCRRCDGGHPARP